MVSELVTGVLRTDNLVMIKVSLARLPASPPPSHAELPDALVCLPATDTILVIAADGRGRRASEALINKLSNSRK